MKRKISGTIAGIGIDVVSIERMGKSLKKQDFSKIVFTNREQREAGRLSARRRIEHLAGCFAAKEAFYKALSSAGGKAGWRDVEIAGSPRKPPRLLVSSKLRRTLERKGIGTIHLSLSHDAGVAAAVVILERR
ncbi:MAG: holo-ACP synthase [Bdellovibrionota bacterium]